MEETSLETSDTIEESTLESPVAAPVEEGAGVMVLAPVPTRVVDAPLEPLPVAVAESVSVEPAPVPEPVRPELVCPVPEDEESGVEAVVADDPVAEPVPLMTVDRPTVMALVELPESDPEDVALPVPDDAPEAVGKTVAEGELPVPVAAPLVVEGSSGIERVESVPVLEIVEESALVVCSDPLLVSALPVLDPAEEAAEVAVEDSSGMERVESVPVLETVEESALVVCSAPVLEAALEVALSVLESVETAADVVVEDSSGIERVESVPVLETVEESALVVCSAPVLEAALLVFESVETGVDVVVEDSSGIDRVESVPVLETVEESALVVCSDPEMDESTADEVVD